MTQGYRAIEVQNKSTQDVPLWHADYFELRATKTLEAQVKPLTYTPNYLEECELGYQR